MIIIIEWYIVCAGFQIYIIYFYENVMIDWESALETFYAMLIMWINIIEFP